MKRCFPVQGFNSKEFGKVGRLSVSIIVELSAFIWDIFLRFANLVLCDRTATVDG